MDISSNKQARYHTRNLRHKITRNWEEKQLYGYFKLQTSEISHQKTWTCRRKGKLRRETDFLIIAVENPAIRTKKQK